MGGLRAGLAQSRHLVCFLVVHDLDHSARLCLRGTISLGSVFDTMPGNRDRDFERAVPVVSSRLLLLFLFSAVSPAGDINHLIQLIAAHNIYLHISRISRKIYYLIFSTYLEFIKLQQFIFFLSPIP